LDQKKNNKIKEKEKDKSTKSINKKPAEKVITNEPIEKEMLKGQEHKEEEKEDKALKESIQKLNVSNNIEIPSISPRIEKEIIEIRPRETYLKDKMLKMNYSAKLISTINKSLDNQVKTIHSEIMDNQVLITAVARNKNKGLPSESMSSGEFPSTKNYDTKSKLKTLKD